MNEEIRPVALVTGAGRGLGAAIARSLAANEWAVVTLVAEVADRLGPIETLVVNASGPQPAIDVAELTWADHLDQLRFFVKSPTILVQATLPAMRERRRGRIINIGSDLVERAASRLSAYSAA